MHSVVGHVVNHPSTMEHHIAGIEMYGVKKDNDQVIKLGRATWAPAYSNHNVRFQINRIGDFEASHARDYCNIHRPWCSLLEI